MSIQILIHVLISLAGIFSGFVVLFGLLTARPLDRWTAVFVSTSLATNLTGFVLPADRLLPSHIVGIISMVALSVAMYARYAARLVGGWRKTYAITATLALYLNVFVLVVQAFLKVPALNALAPKQSEPPFAITQGLVLLGFIVLTILATIRFRVQPVGAAGAGRVRSGSTSPQDVMR